MTSTTEILADLIAVQNDPRNWNRDILTIVGIAPAMTDDELLLHARHEAAALARSYPGQEPDWLNAVIFRLAVEARLRAPALAA